MKRFWIFALMIGYLLGLLALGSPAGAAEKNFQSFVLTNEGSGFISKLVVAGYGTYALYDAVVAMQQLSDLYIAGVLTDPFLETLAHCPAGSEIFTHQLNEFNLPGISLAVNEDGTMRDRERLWIILRYPARNQHDGIKHIRCRPDKADLFTPGQPPHLLDPHCPTRHHPLPCLRLAWAGYRLDLPIIFKAGGD